MEHAKMLDTHRSRSTFVLGLCCLLAGSVVACAGPAPTPPPAMEEAQEVVDALDTDRLRDIGYTQPEKVVAVEGLIVRTYYARESKGQPTFLDFHDPYEGYFTCMFWQEDRETGEPIRDRFVAAFPPNPETYFLDRRVIVTGPIGIYQGDPEIVLHDPSQIRIVE